MSDFEAWIYRGVICALLVVCWYFAKLILSQLKDMNAKLQIISDKSISHDGKFELLQEIVHEHKTKLAVHSDRIRKLEQKQDRCKSCREA